VSYKVTEEVLNSSRAKQGSRLVLVALSEVAAHDGTVWSPIGPPSYDDSIAYRTKLTERQVKRCLKTLQALDELEIRQWRQGRKLWNIYRVIVGRIREKEVNYERPELAAMNLLERFWTIDELHVARAFRPRMTSAESRRLGDILSPSHEADSASDQGTSSTSDEVTSAPEPGDISDRDVVTLAPECAGALRKDPSLGTVTEPSAAGTKDKTEGSGVGVRPLRATPIEAHRSAAAQSANPASIESAVASLARLRGWDTNSIKVVEPLMSQLPAAEFAATLERTLSRRNVENPPGLFVFLLRTAIGDWRKTQTEQRLAVWDGLFGEQGIEHVKRTDPERYVLAWATAPVDVKPLPAYAILPHILDYLFEYVPELDERRRLCDLYDTKSKQAPSIGTWRDWILVGLERRTYVYAEVVDVITTFAHAPVRAELLAFAAEIHANIIAGQEQVA
jgi:hypothetical protein